RQRRKHEELANEIFGRGRKEKATQNGNRKAGIGQSLASRVGIAKASQRSNSNTPKPKPDVDSPWAHDLHRAENGRPRVTRTARQNPMVDKVKHELLSEALAAKGAPSTPSLKAVGPEISIRGAAGPYVVIGSNFAPGTTAADIESAMIPSGGEMQSCRIITASPTVMAEMVFSEKHNAEAVIEMFNNKKADGRILHVYMKMGGPTPIASIPAAQRALAESQSNPIDFTRIDISPSYDSQREQTDRNRRRANPEIQDGSYGFENKEERMDVDAEAPPPAPRGDNRRDERRDTYRDDRGPHRGDARYDAPRDVGRSGYYDRGWDGGRPRDDRRLYSDGLYSRPRGRDYR
ncbi:MAG: hypothetical protein Q9217_007017, partial [Psora testacea]